MDYLHEINASLGSLNEYTMYEDIVTLRDIDDELNELEEFTVVQLGDADGINNSEMANKDPQKSSSGSTSTTTTTKNQKKTMKTKKEKTTAKNGKGSTKTSIPSSSPGGKGGVSSSSSKKKLQGLLVLRPRSLVVIDAKGNRFVPFSLQYDLHSHSKSFFLFTSPHHGIMNFVGDTDDGSNGVNTSIGVALPPLIVGRSSKQNDRVSFEVAKEHHLWFHVQGSPGSHCLLQLDPGDKGRTSEECLQYAAGSFYFSIFCFPCKQYTLF